MVLEGKLAGYSVQANQGVIVHDGERVVFSGAEWKSKRMPAKGMRVRAEVADGAVVSVRAMDELQAESASAQPLDVRRHNVRGSARPVAVDNEANKVFLLILRDMFIIAVIAGLIILVYRLLI